MKKTKTLVAASIVAALLATASTVGAYAESTVVAPAPGDTSDTWYDTGVTPWWGWLRGELTVQNQAVNMRTVFFATGTHERITLFNCTDGYGNGFGGTYTASGLNASYNCAAFHGGLSSAAGAINDL